MKDMYLTNQPTKQTKTLVHWDSTKTTARKEENGPFLKLQADMICMETYWFISKY